MTLSEGTCTTRRQSGQDSCALAMSATSKGSLPAALPPCSAALCSIWLLIHGRGGKLQPRGRNLNSLSGQRAAWLKTQPCGGGQHGHASLRATRGRGSSAVLHVSIRDTGYRWPSQYVRHNVRLPSNMADFCGKFHNKRWCGNGRNALCCHSPPTARDQRHCSEPEWVTASVKRMLTATTHGLFVAAAVSRQCGWLRRQ
jgi:hypothetical protein